MNREQHWKLLRYNNDSKPFQKVVSSIIDNFQELFRFKLTGEVVEVNPRDYMVGFNLTAKKIESDYKGELGPKEIFPKYESYEYLTYKCSAREVNNIGPIDDLEKFSDDIIFDHKIYVSKPVVPIILDRFRKNGIYIDKLNDTQPPTMKEIVSSDEYIQNICDGMKLADSLVNIKN